MWKNSPGEPEPVSGNGRSSQFPKCSHSCLSHGAPSSVIKKTQGRRWGNRCILSETGLSWHLDRSSRRTVSSQFCHCGTCGSMRYSTAVYVISQVLDTWTNLASLSNQNQAERWVGNRVFTYVSLQYFIDSVKMHELLSVFAPDWTSLRNFINYRMRFMFLATI